MTLADLVLNANTGADAIKKAPILEENTGLRCLRIGDVSQKREYVDWGFTKTTEADYKRYKLEVDDLIIARTGNTIGVNCIIEDEINSVYNNGLIRIKADKTKVIPRYLWYMISSKECQDFVQSIAFGTSTQPNMKINDFLRYSFDYQDLDVQKKIVEIIDPIDKKIKANNAINRNLSEQAISIVNEWETNEQGHIDYKKVEDVAELNPESYSSKDDWNLINYLDTSSITEGNISELIHIVPSEEKLPSRAKRKLKCKDIVYSTVRPNQKHYGFISEPAENMLVSTGFVVIRTKSSLLCSELLYLLITRELVTEKMQQIAEGSTSTFPSIKPSDLGNCEIPVPKEECNMELIAGLSNIFECIHINQKENQRLSELRDSLLPKLMSGELDVCELTE